MWNYSQNSSGKIAEEKHDYLSSSYFCGVWDSASPPGLSGIILY